MTADCFSQSGFSILQVREVLFMSELSWDSGIQYGCRFTSPLEECSAAHAHQLYTVKGELQLDFHLALIEKDFSGLYFIFS